MSEEVQPELGPPKNLAAGLIKAVRPRQWIKNLLVLAAPLAAVGSGIQYDYADLAYKVAIAFEPRRAPSDAQAALWLKWAEK